MTWTGPGLDLDLTWDLEWDLEWDLDLSLTKLRRCVVLSEGSETTGMNDDSAEHTNRVHK